MGVISDVWLLTGVGVPLAVGYGALRNRPERGSITLAVFMGTILTWSGFHFAAHLSSPTLTTPFRRLTWLGIGSLSFAWVAFAIDYIGRRDLLTPRSVVLLAAWPVGLNVAIWTVPGLWTSIYETEGSVFAIHLILSYTLLLVGAAILVYHALTRNQLFRRQVWAVLSGIVILFGATFAALTGVFEQLHAHPLPVGLALAGLPFLWAVYGGQLTDVVPVAGSSVLEAIDAGVVVVDDDGRVTHVTDQGTSLLELGNATAIVGQPFEEVLTSATELAPDKVELFLEAAPGDRFTVTIADRFIETRVTATDHSGSARRLAFLLSDVSERERRKRQLASQNERLDEFAGVVSHDLRNPLAIAKGSIANIRSSVDGENEAIDRTERALDRIDAIIDDVLTMARDGDTVESPGPVSLSAVIRDAWSNVPTKDATLSDETDDVVVRADRSRLLELLENLFANAVDHAGEAVTVTVEAGEDWFAVVDDGPGISTDDPASLFEPGYTSRTDGTGFGLNIVETICSAHGWSVTARDADAGGARFEISHVETVADEATTNTPTGSTESLSSASTARGEHGSRNAAIDGNSETDSME